MSRDGKVQVNVLIPVEWRTTLLRLAHLQSLEENSNVTYSELIRQAISEKFNLGDTTDKKEEAK